MNAHSAGPHGVPVASDIACNELLQFAFALRNSCDLPFAPFGQTGGRSNGPRMLDSRTQGREIGRRGKIVGIDEKRRIRIGGRDFNATSAPRPEEAQPNGKTLIGPDFRGPHRGSGEHSVQAWTIGLFYTSKEKMTASSRCRKWRLRFGNKSYQETMILKILAHAGEIAHNGDAVAAQLFGIADS